MHNVAVSQMCSQSFVIIIYTNHLFVLFNSFRSSWTGKDHCAAICGIIRGSGCLQHTQQVWVFEADIFFQLQLGVFSPPDDCYFTHIQLLFPPLLSPVRRILEETEQLQTNFRCSFNMQWNVVYSSFSLSYVIEHINFHQHKIARDCLTQQLL